MSKAVINNLCRLAVLLAIAGFLLMRPTTASARSCCSDCPSFQGNIGGPDCPNHSACWGCWTSCQPDCSSGCGDPAICGTCTVIQCTCDDGGTNCRNCEVFDFMC